MSQGTGIEWTDRTWNCLTGCTPVSRGCSNCFASHLAATRLKDTPRYKGLATLNSRGQGVFNGKVLMHEDKLLDPLKWPKPSMVFVNSMSDVFHESVPFAFIDRMFAVMALCPQHTFQILTKRPERMAEYFATYSGGITFSKEQDEQLAHYFPAVMVEDLCNGGESTTMRQLPGWWDRLNKVKDFGIAAPPNVWLGTSCENQGTADERIPHLLKCPAAVRFLSCEPLLGEIDIAVAMYPPDGRCGGSTFGFTDGVGHEACIQWVIAGGESGPSARPMHPEWARSLRDQCKAAGVPFFFKQWGEWVDEMHELADPHSQKTYDGFATVAPDGSDYTGVYMCRVGKKRAGRLLDGVDYSEFPK